MNLNSGDPDDPPLAKSSLIPSTSISFCWTPANCEFEFYPASRRRFIVLLEGTMEVVVNSCESRLFTVGDVLEVGGVTGHGHVCRAAEGRPFRSASINLDDNLTAAQTKAVSGSPVVKELRYLRTSDGPNRKSVTTSGHLPYRHSGPGGIVTDEVPITGFQFVLAPPDLDYAWHRAPQFQFVIPITGGMEIENGQGERHKVLPGEIYVGQDVAGEGHITRAIDGQERLSIFAHLKSALC